jgi:hypothetical protein
MVPRRPGAARRPYSGRRCRQGRSPRRNGRPERGDRRCLPREVRPIRGKHRREHRQSERASRHAQARAALARRSGEHHASPPIATPPGPSRLSASSFHFHARGTNGVTYPSERPDHLRHGGWASPAPRRTDRSHLARRPDLLRARRRPVAWRRLHPLHTHLDLTRHLQANPCCSLGCAPQIAPTELTTPTRSTVPAPPSGLPAPRERRPTVTLRGTTSPSGPCP